MISARANLIRQLQQFVETYMRGLYSWGDVAVRTPEPADKVPGRKQLDREVAVIDFDGYALSASSPDEAPPLGRILLFHPEIGQIDGPLDVTTWVRVANAIKRHLKEDLNNGARRSNSAGEQHQ